MLIEKDLIVKAITSSTMEVFTTMLSEEPSVGDSFAERNASGVVDGLVALIGLTGPLLGTGMVTCNATLASQLSAMLLMADEIPTEGTAIDEEVLDSLAEITNMIIGNVKNALEHQVGELNLSIPTVVYGRNLTTRSNNEGEWVVVPFGCRGHHLEVRLCLTPNKGKTTHRPALSLAHTSDNPVHQSA